jgi:transposase
MMADEGLFEGLPEQKGPQAEGRGAPRLRVPERGQVDMHWAALDDLIPDDHPVRAVWAFALRLDLSALHEAIKAREGQPGHPPAAPELMMALWLWATIDGVGSARQLDRLCREHLVYRWLCGGVSMNYHSLSDFRVAHQKVLDQLLARGVASLVEAGLVSLDTLAQDGLRVRTSAGAGSFRRRKRLEELRTAAQARVARLRAELEADPGSSDKGRQAAQQRAAREREARIAAAQERMQELEAERARREKTNRQDVAKQKEPRASTTDAEARVMKMADGGFRPAYNVQLAADTGAQVIVGVEVSPSGSDQDAAPGMVAQVERRLGALPDDWLMDGGFAKHAAIEAIAAQGPRVLAPVPTPKAAARDPHAPLPKDSAVIAAWRIRMGADDAKATYKRRAATIECVNAQARAQYGLTQVRVRGLAKVRCVALWVALAHNLRLLVRRGPARAAEPVAA